MTEHEEEIHGYASWLVSTLAMLQILKNNNAEGHSQQLNYVFRKSFAIAEKQYGDEFLLIFDEIFSSTYPNHASNKKPEVLH